jgi:hypothetical protein
MSKKILILSVIAAIAVGIYGQYKLISGIHFAIWFLPIIVFYPLITWKLIQKNKSKYWKVLLKYELVTILYHVLLVPYTKILYSLENFNNTLESLEGLILFSLIIISFLFSLIYIVVIACYRNECKQSSSFKDAIKILAGVIILCSALYTIYTNGELVEFIWNIFLYPILT